MYFIMAAQSLTLQSLIPSCWTAFLQAFSYSMMPDGLLSELKEADVLDLIKYLQTQK